eukprot:34293_1
MCAFLALALFVVFVQSQMDCNTQFDQEEILYDDAHTFNTLQWTANTDSIHNNSRHPSYRITNKTDLCVQGDCYLLYADSNGSSPVYEATLTTSPGIITTEGFTNIHIIYSVMALGMRNGSCDLRYSVDNFNTSNRLIYSQFAFFAVPTQHTLVTAPFGKNANNNSNLQLRLVTNVYDANLCVFDELRMCGDSLMPTTTEAMNELNESREIVYAWHHEVFTVDVLLEDNVYYATLNVNTFTVYLIVGVFSFVSCCIGVYAICVRSKICRKRTVSRAMDRYHFSRASFQLYM